MKIYKLWKKIAKVPRDVLHRGCIAKWYCAWNERKYMKWQGAYLRKLGIRLEGEPNFISYDCYFDGSDYGLIKLGNNVVISREVMFLTHDYSILSGITACEKLDANNKHAKFLKEISIGENCFIGARASLLPGTKIGKGCIIGAGAVVKGVFPEFSIVCGNPARVVGDTHSFVEKHIEKNDFISM